MTKLFRNLGFKFVNNFFYLMLKKYSQIVSILFVGVFGFFVTNASAIDLDEATRTVVQDGNGKTTVLTPEQVKRGKRLFGASCGSCHTGGITKTNPNIGLDPEGLSLATPNRNSVAGLVDYLKNPTTFDGLESNSSIFSKLLINVGDISRSNIFPASSNLSLIASPKSSLKRLLTPSLFFP